MSERLEPDEFPTPSAGPREQLELQLPLWGCEEQSANISKGEAMLVSQAGCRAALQKEDSGWISSVHCSVLDQPGA